MIGKSARDSLRHKVCGADIQAKNKIKVCARHVDKWCWPIGAGIVYQDVEWWLDANGSLHCIEIANIERD